MNFYKIYLFPLTSLVFFIAPMGCTSHSFDTKNYEDSLYKVLLFPSIDSNIRDSSASVLGQVIESAVLVGTKVPPGAYADYGSLLHSQGKYQEAIAAWTRETELYPESKPLLEQLLSKKSSTLPSDNVPDNQEQKGDERSYRLRSILIWPPVNQTQQPAAASAFQATIRGPLLEKGYYVFPAFPTQDFLNTLGINDPQNLTSLMLEKIKNQIGADAILVITITEWNNPENFLGFKGTTVHVGASYRLIEVPSGKDLWRVSSRDEVNEQVPVSVHPLYFQVIEHLIPARVLNRKAIGFFSREFPSGPYFSPKTNKIIS